LSVTPLLESRLCISIGGNSLVRISKCSADLLKLASVYIAFARGKGKLEEALECISFLVTAQKAKRSYALCLFAW
jgi:hypothetical protein